MSGGLEKINRTGASEAELMFRDCCGSSRWSSSMTAARPFESEAELMATAASIWNRLERGDWLEAFSAHPKIGESKAAVVQQARAAKWSAGEQSSLADAGEVVKQDLAEANAAYFEKFGFIFIVCATGKTAAEMLELCRIRLTNDRDAEVAIAASEQEKITEIRLKKLLHV